MKKASRTDPEGFARVHTPTARSSRATITAAVGVVASCGALVLLRLALRLGPVSPAYRLLRSKRYVMLHSLLHTPDLMDQVSQIAALLDEIDRRAVDHEKRRLCILMEEGPVRLDQPFEILLRDAPLEVPVPLP
jgi:hypothetical protein